MENTPIIIYVTINALLEAPPLNFPNENKLLMCKKWFYGVYEFPPNSSLFNSLCYLTLYHVFIVKSLKNPFIFFLRLSIINHFSFTFFLDHISTDYQEVSLFVVSPPITDEHQLTCSLIIYSLALRLFSIPASLKWRRVTSTLWEERISRSSLIWTTSVEKAGSSDKVSLRIRTKNHMPTRYWLSHENYRASLWR